MGTGETLEAYSSISLAYLVKFQWEILSYPLNLTCMHKHKFVLCCTHLCMHINIFKYLWTCPHTHIYTYTQKLLRKTESKFLSHLKHPIIKLRIGPYQFSINSSSSSRSQTPMHVQVAFLESTDLEYTTHDDKLGIFISAVSLQLSQISTHKGNYPDITFSVAHKT